ncbi:MAG: hypothetical protein JNJ86_14205 [Chitinophagaceae bacterium]|nr:hypothetical protein [Chitinophagaceae bacterium]
MNYENRIVAFIDILGFAELVKQTVNDKEPALAEQKLNALYYVVEYVTDFIRLSRDEIGFEGDTKTTLFSDSIVISIDKANSHGILAIFRALKKLQIHLIKDGILLRGGIVHGKLIHKDDILIGPGLINAYRLESSSALYPRIVIDPKVTYLYSRQGGKTMGKMRIRHFDYHKTFSKDSDGTSYIDYFNDVSNYLNSGTIENYIKELDSIIKRFIRNDDIGIRMKYMWMREKLKQSEYAALIPKPVKKIKKP